jgi:hypothetical protein
MLQHFDISNPRLSTGQATCYKELLVKGGSEFLVFYSHLQAALEVRCTFQSTQTPSHLLNLATGIPVAIQQTKAPDWFTTTFQLPPQQGYYLKLKSLEK